LACNNQEICCFFKAVINLLRREGGGLLRCRWCRMAGGCFTDIQ